MIGVGDYGSGRYTASTGSTTTTVTSGSNPSTGGTNSGVRRVRLARPPAGSSAPCAPPTFGFSVRGGREYSTGFFVSYVEPASEAYNQGLKVGDQVVRVNGFRVSDALHKELLSLISGLNYLKLKVRNVGMIPVKDKPNDPLTWRMVPDSMLFSDSSQRSSPTLINVHKENKVKDVRLTLYVPSRSKLGCGICKGPDWRPGIFVQFTKENGIARESGLRPGDQIMQCNGIDFRDIQFSDAVALMKQTKRLDLWVRTGAGQDLFPGESSGYNSSASSATGDQSPSSADHKRLSIVKEETLDLEDRLSQLDNARYKRKNWDHRNFEWERESSIKECDSEFVKDFYDSQMNNCVHPTSIYNSFDKDKSAQNRTIINLSENGTTIQTNYVLPTMNDNLCNDVSPITNVVSDKKTIIVDVHRSDVECKDRHVENVTNIECKIDENLPPLKKAPSINSLVSLTNSTGSSLSNAISQELQKRSQRKKENGFTFSQLEESRKNKMIKGVDDEKKQKHDALMDEFKKAHRKMFANSNNNDDTSSTYTTEKSNEEKFVKEPDNEKFNYSAVLGDRPLNAYSRTTTIPRESPVINKSNGVTNDAPKRNFKPPDQPPPPPPMPVNNNNNKGFIPSPKLEPVNNKIVASHTKPKAPPPPPLKKPIQNGNGNHINEDRPPATPTPDYDTVSLIKVTNKVQAPNKIKSDIVEMESLESFKLNHPLSPDPKPPSTYFMKQQNGTLTMKKASQSISVTIGEYPTNTFRKQPAKLDFLNGDTVDGYKNNEPVGSRLQSELTQKLSRSNLKKKTESDKISNGDSSVNPFDSNVNDEPNANFNKRYGHVVLPQPPMISIPKVPIGKSLSHNPSTNGGANDANRIVVNAQNGKHELVKTESLPQNGILKSSVPVFATPIKIGMQHKSIKFGQTTTVIGDPEVPLIVNH